MTLSERDRVGLLRISSPAVLLLLGMLVLVGLRPLLQDRIFLRYKTVVANSLATGDMETAELFADKLRLLAAPQPEPDVLLHCAQIDQYRGKTKEAYATISQLAPETTMGYGEAHLWMARQLLTESPVPNVHQIKSLIHHLECAVQRNPDSIEAHELFGQILVHQDRYEDAIPSLLIGVNLNPGLHVALAQCYRRIGKPSLEREHLERAEKHYKELTSQPDSQVNDIAKLAEVLGEQAQFLKAEQLLTTAIEDRRHANDHQSTMVLSRVLAKICMQESRRIRTETQSLDPAGFLRSLFLLGKSLTHDVGNESGIRELLVLSDPESELGVRAEQLLIDHSELGGRGQFTTHLVLGCRALSKQPPSVAAEHFRLATETFKNTPAVLSNAAWMIVRPEEISDNHDDLALQFCNQSIGLVSHRATILPLLLERRGRILMHMQRWTEAIADLRKVLEYEGDRRHVHNLLATAYDAVDDKARANEHRQLSGLR